LGVLTPTSVTLEGQGAGQTVVAEFDKADASKLGDVTGKAVEKQLAILLDGKVLSVALTPFRGHLVREDVHHGTHTSGVYS
jgi:preprotein translocase subunit SecD